ncbi:MAG: hypothetical protein K2M55_02750 [Muribaculaceae bacterium]|nr:hypothetical protein [Muribaculaceae bacterium]
MMQTLQEALYANSLEHKSEMPIKAALEPEEEEEKQAQTENDTELYVQESI